MAKKALGDNMTTRGAKFTSNEKGEIEMGEEVVEVKKGKVKHINVKAQGEDAHQLGD